MRAGVGDSGQSTVAHHGDSCADQHQQGRHEDGDGGHLHFMDFDFFAEIFRCPANHQPGNKDRHDGKEQHAVEAGANAAEDHFAQLHQNQRNHAAERGKGVVHGVNRAARCGRCYCSKQSGVGDAETRFLAFHVAERGIDTQMRQQWIALLLEVDGGTSQDDKQQGHRGEYRPALALVADHAPEGKAQRSRDQEDRQHFDEVG